MAYCSTQHDLSHGFAQPLMRPNPSKSPFPQRQLDKWPYFAWRFPAREPTAGSELVKTHRQNALPARLLGWARVGSATLHAILNFTISQNSKENSHGHPEKIRTEDTRRHRAAIITAGCGNYPPGEAGAQAEIRHNFDKKRRVSEAPRWGMACVGTVRKLIRPEQ